MGAIGKFNGDERYSSPLDILFIAYWDKRAVENMFVISYYWRISAFL